MKMQTKEKQMRKRVQRWHIWKTVFLWSHDEVNEKIYFYFGSVNSHSVKYQTFSRFLTIFITRHAIVHKIQVLNFWSLYIRAETKNIYLKQNYSKYIMGSAANPLL